MSIMAREEAKKEWKSILKGLTAAGRVSKMNLTSFAGYCQSYARWKEAEKFITKHGWNYQ